MRLWLSVLIILGVSFIVPLISFGIYKSLVVKEVMAVPMDVQVGSGIGINTDTDALHFGGTIPGGTSQRSFRIQNDYGFRVMVRVNVQGDLANWTRFKPSTFSLRPGESRQVQFTCFVPKNAPYGNYTGIINVKIARDLF